MAQTAFILILAEDEAAGTRLRDGLRERFGHSCKFAPTLADAVESIREKSPNVVVADATVHGEPTVQPLADLLDAVAEDAALLLIGDGPEPRAPARIRITRIAAQTPPERLLGAVNTAATRAVSRREDRILRESIAGQRFEVFEGIVGASPPIKDIISKIRKAARNKLTVLILGETGTGKELIAQAIHNQSGRAERPFKALNCSALQETLLESQLFGHVRGAFTGAIADSKGFFVAADGGTLFLDEIGDMPLHMQPKLLRVLEHREVTPVGSTDVRRVDVRVIAATNANLQKLVEEKKFREDLYYRLHQWDIYVPPLRQRRQDIPLLADYFRREANRKHDVACDGISSEAMTYLTKYFWPGNVRELANLIEKTTVEVTDRQIEADDLPEHIRGSREIVPASSGGLVGLTMAQVERMMIERTLQATSGNREQTAKLLGIGTRTLYRKIKEYGL
jgi:two-component system response regulator HydG